MANKLALISGASRGIGKAFADHYRSEIDTIVIGISHSNKSGLEQLDLLNEVNVNKFVRELKLRNTQEIVYIHAVGIDKFEPDAKPEIDYDHDGIDDEVYATNVTAFLNLAEPLIERVKQTKLPMTICGIGSVSDLYQVPYWQSFSRSKDIIRKYLKSIVSPEIKSIMLNVSTTLDEEGRKYGRQNADTTYWQTAEELVKNSVENLNGMRNSASHYAEFDFYKFNPNFRPDYFTNLPKLFSLWQRDMGFVGKPVPHGIRI